MLMAVTILLEVLDFRRFARPRPKKAIQVCRAGLPPRWGPWRSRGSIDPTATSRASSPAGSVSPLQPRRSPGKSVAYSERWWCRRWHSED